MKEEFSAFLLDKVNKFTLFLSVGFTFASLVFFLIKLPNLPPYLPLFYNRPWGVPQLARPIELFLVLVTDISILVLNTTLAITLYKNIALLSRVLMLVATLITLLCATTIIRIILLIS